MALSWLSHKKQHLADIWVVSDSSHRCQQAIAVANHLEQDYKIIEAEDITPDFVKQYAPPRIIIGAGKACAEPILLVKQLSKNKSYSAIILDPQTQHDAFDLIIVPGYEPHPEGSNVLTTTGLLSKINTEVLAREKDKFTQGTYPELKGSITSTPIITVLVGGNYIGGSYNVTYVKELCEQINHTVNKKGGYALISTSGRTSAETTQALLDNITVPYFLYDFHRYRHMKNPYKPMLAIADEIVVTGDSIRMICEACATGIPVHIAEPQHDFKPYAPLYKQLYEGGYAQTFTGDETAEEPAKPLLEAKRIADYIKSAIS